jgi:hypothetical protein
MFWQGTDSRSADSPSFSLDYVIKVVRAWVDSIPSDDADCPLGGGVTVKFCSWLIVKCGLLMKFDKAAVERIFSGLPNIY